MSQSWTPAATQAFQSLKEAFTSAPLLIHLDPNKSFIVEVDATRVTMVLSKQQGKPATPSMCLLFQNKFRNYDIGNRERLTIKLAL